MFSRDKYLQTSAERLFPSDRKAITVTLFSLFTLFGVRCDCNNQYVTAISM